MGQKYSAEYKADVLKLSDEIGVRAACEQRGLSTKTVYNWRREERLKHGELRGVQPGEQRSRRSSACFVRTKNCTRQITYSVKRWVLWRVDNRCTSAGTVCMDQ